MWSHATFDLTDMNTTTVAWTISIVVFETNLSPLRSGKELLTFLAFAIPFLLAAFAVAFPVESPWRFILSLALWILPVLSLIN